jgi:hypothetical protein
MKRFWIILGWLLISALLLALAGCGDGTGDASGEPGNTGTKGTVNTGEIETTVTKTSPRSKSEFLQFANGICQRSFANRTAEIIQYIQEHQKQGASEEELGVEAYRAVVVPKLPARIEEVRALGAPKGYEKHIEAVLASLRRIINTPDRLLFREVSRTSKLARRYGIGRCAG